jgi:hypothetical protein
MSGVSDIKSIRYQTYQTRTLSDTKPLRYRTTQILNLSDTEPLRYQTSQIPNLSDTEPLRYWTSQIPNLSETEPKDVWLSRLEFWCDQRGLPHGCVQYFLTFQPISSAKICIKLKEGDKTDAWAGNSEMVSRKITRQRFPACVVEQDTEEEGSWEQEKWLSWVFRLDVFKIVRILL